MNKKVRLIFLMIKSKTQKNDIIKWKVYLTKVNRLRKN